MFEIEIVNPKSRNKLTPKYRPLLPDMVATRHKQLFPFKLIIKIKYNLKTSLTLAEFKCSYITMVLISDSINRTLWSQKVLLDSTALEFYSV